MTLVEDDYRPEFGALVVQDRNTGTWIAAPNGLGDYPARTAPVGTVAVAGAAWLRGAAREPRHEIRIESHDSVPIQDPGDWDDVLETPYFSSSGAVELSHVTGGSDSPPLVLGDPGPYRVRVSCRATGAQLRSWQLRFWPSDPVEPPRWLRRGSPPVERWGGRWNQVLGWPANELTTLLHGASGPAGVTLAELEEWCIGHNRTSTWLREPLWTDPPPTAPTGHPDLDAAAEQNRNELIERQERERGELDGIASQFGLPAPANRLDLLGLQVALGIVTYDASTGRYRCAEEPPRPQDVVVLPPDRRRAVDLLEGAARYGRLTEDLLSIAAWGPMTERLGDLASRLLVPTADVLAALRHAADAGRLGEIELPQEPDPYAPVTVRRASRPAPTDPVVVYSAPARTGTVSTGAGPPPRAGVVDARGSLVVWRDGEPLVLATPRDEVPGKALETAFGTVLLYRKECLLIRPDGSVEALGGAGLGGRGARVSDDGRRLAVPTTSGGFGLYLVDLAEKTRQRMPWPRGRDVKPVGVHAGVVYVNGEPPPDGQSTIGSWTGWRWTPGSEPERMDCRWDSIDPVSGTVLRFEPDHRRVVVTPDGTRHPIHLDPSARLTPGGAGLYAFRGTPPAVTLFRLETGVDDPHVTWLPEGLDLSSASWESPGHLLIPVRENPAIRGPGVRVDVGAGRVETLGGARAAGSRPMLVEPWLGA